MILHFPSFKTIVVVVFTLIFIASGINTAVAGKPGSKKLHADHSISENNDTDGFEDEFAQDDDSDFMEEEGPSSTPVLSDPLAPFNRAMFTFNDKLYFWILKPVCQGYNKVVILPVRTAIRNFFTNLEAPARMINCFLQGNGERLGNEIGRFMLNTTFGLFGFMDPAHEDPRLIHDSEDLGQTLALYGIGDGCYLVLPFLGSSTLRDAVGSSGDAFFTPTSYIPSWELSLGISTFEAVNDTSFKIGDYEALKSASIVPYDAIRDVYAQYRQKQIED